MLTGLDHLVVTVTDISRAVDFYTRVLGWKRAIKRPNGSI